MITRREVLVGIASVAATPAMAQFNGCPPGFCSPAASAPVVGNILAYFAMGVGGPMAVNPTGTTRDANADFIMFSDM